MWCSTRWGRSACAVLAALLGACAGPDTRPDVDRMALTDTLTALIESAYDFETPGTLERMNALYASSEGVVSASGGRITVSADSVRQGVARFWESAGQNMRNARWVWGQVYVEPLGSEGGVLTSTWSIPHIAPDGQPHVIEGAWPAVFQRLDGDWKIVHEHLSVPGG